jgi:hypothetical protein
LPLIQLIRPGLERRKELNQMGFQS